MVSSLLSHERATSEQYNLRKYVKCHIWRSLRSHCARYLWFVCIASALLSVSLCLISEVWRRVGGRVEDLVCIFCLMNSWCWKKKAFGEREGKDSNRSLLPIIPDQATDSPATQHAHTWTQSGFMHSKQTLCQLLKEYCTSVVYNFRRSLSVVAISRNELIDTYICISANTRYSL